MLIDIHIDQIIAYFQLNRLLHWLLQDIDKYIKIFTYFKK